MWLVDSVEWYLAHVASFISKQIETHGSLLILKISRELFFVCRCEQAVLAGLKCYKYYYLQP